MRNLLIRNEDGTYTVNGATYALRIAGHQIEIFIENNRYATLYDVLCQKPQMMTKGLFRTPNLPFRN